MDKPAIRVLMIGPGEGVGGGIAALLDALLPALRARVRLLYFPSVSRRPLKDSGKFSLKNVMNAGSQYVRFIIAVVRFRPQLVHVHTSQGIAWLKDTFYVLASKLFGCRVVLHMHGGNFDVIHRQSPSIIQWYTRQVLQLADKAIVVSKGWESRILGIVESSKVLTLLNCVDLNEFPPGTDRFDPSQAARAVFVGRVGVQKGVFDLIEALGVLRAQGRPVPTWIIGGEEEPGDMQKACARLEELHLADTCELFGNVDRQKKDHFLSLANIFLLPSYYEGLPMAVLEAMAAGLPIVATPVGGIPEVVYEGQNGYLVQPGDIPALSGRIAVLAADPGQRKNMGRRSREIAEQEFDVQLYAERLVSLYGKLLDGK